MDGAAMCGVPGASCVYVLCVVQAWMVTGSAGFQTPACLASSQAYQVTVMAGWVWKWFGLVCCDICLTWVYLHAA